MRTVTYEIKNNGNIISTASYNEVLEMKAKCPNLVVTTHLVETVEPDTRTEKMKENDRKRIEYWQNRGKK